MFVVGTVEQLRLLSSKLFARLLDMASSNDRTLLVPGQPETLTGQELNTAWKPSAVLPSSSMTASSVGGSACTRRATFRSSELVVSEDRCATERTRWR